MGNRIQELNKLLNESANKDAIDTALKMFEAEKLRQYTMPKGQKKVKDVMSKVRKLIGSI